MVAFLLALLLAQAETIFFPSGPLRIEAYQYRPPGSGPFPALVYNHGSRIGFEREERRFPWIADAFVPAGYVVLVVERRGYGRSDGETFADEVGRERGAKFAARLEAEADDVGAAVDYLRRQPFVDAKRVAMLGWSFGGILTVITCSRRGDVAAAVDQATGALSWKGSPALQRLLRDAAAKVHVPLLTMVAANDATTEAARTIDAAIPVPTEHRLIVYPPFHPKDPRGVAEGHLVFSGEGIAIWKDDALAWIGRHLGL